MLREIEENKLANLIRQSKESVADNSDAKRPARRGRVIEAWGGHPELEHRVLTFERGDAEVLVSTSVIENGLDLPNANTLIVESAHLFGLAQLHQIRGRVGRRARQAYAFFFIPSNAEMTLTANARDRLDALNALRTGDQIANKDLAIRGAGSLFGEHQSGDIQDVGYTLYVIMLRKALGEMRILSNQSANI
eukprot:1279382-Amorphochlora_amoeboformis.AAC.1